MRRVRRTLRLLRSAVLLAVSAFSASAQVSSSFEQSNVQVTPRVRVGQILPERNATASINTRVSGDELGGAGTTQESYVQEAFTTYDNFFQAAQQGHRRVPKIGGTRGSLRMSAPMGPQVQIPLFEWGGKPEDAELKLGRLYLDLFTLSGSVLYSDNVAQNEVERDAEAIGIVRLQGRMILQVTETMRFGAGGTVAWLPFENEIGFSDPLANFGASLQPVFLTRFDYEIPLGPLTSFNIYDNFTVQSGGFGESRSFDTLQRDVDDLTDREGRRVFIQRRTFDDTDRLFRPGFSILNNSTAEISSLLPTETRVTAGYTRTHLWFAQGAPGQQSSQDIWRFNAANERENMRFKPELEFQARHQNNRPGYDKTIRGGFTGPISPYLDFAASGGVLLSSVGTQNFLWRIGLLNRIRESTTHSVVFTRSLTFPAAQLVDQLSYRLQQVLSPDLVFEAGYDRREFEPIANPGGFLGQKEDQADVRFLMRLGQRFRGSAGYSYFHSVARGVGGRRSDRHIYRLELVIDHTSVTESSLLYEFQRRLSNRVNDSFDENVVTYTLTRKF
jgi:hypothetical protein